MFLPWTEEPGGLHSPWGCKESEMTERLTLNLHSKEISYEKFNRLINSI